MACAWAGAAAAAAAWNCEWSTATAVGCWGTRLVEVRRDQVGRHCHWAGGHTWMSGLCTVLCKVKPSLSSYPTASGAAAFLLIVLLFWQTSAQVGMESEAASQPGEVCVGDLECSPFYYFLLFFVISEMTAQCPNAPYWNCLATGLSCRNIISNNIHSPIQRIASFTVKLLSYSIMREMSHVAWENSWTLACTTTN